MTMSFAPTRHLWTILAALVCCLTSGIAATPASAAGKPNVVFILADDLGWTDLGCQGSKFYETPHIDRLAATGMRFTNGYTCGPNCQPTRAALMSGQYGPRTGVYTVGSIDRFNWPSRPLRPVDNVQTLPADRQTLGGAFKQAGYATGMFGKWHLGNDAAHHPGRRGFDEAIVSAGRHFEFKTDPPVEHPRDEYLADFLTDRAVDFLKRHQDEPFFLYLPHFGVHSPFEAKAETIARFRGRAAAGGHYDPTYAAMIASVDESVGRILATLDELHLADNTLVIFSSDNGGVGGYQRQGVDAKDITDNAPLRGGKGMLYEGGVRVPYLFRWPGVIPPGTTCDAPINSVDLYPTLLQVIGGAQPPQTLDGVSYLAVLKSGNAAPLENRPLFWHFPGYLGSSNDTWRTLPAGSIRLGDWKLLEFFEDGRRELYNLRDDVGEQHDLASANPAKVDELHAQLVAWRQQVGAKLPTKNEPTNSGPQAATKGKGKKKQKARQETKTSAIESNFHAVRCAGRYPGHLQGICTNDRNAIYWCFTTVLVKTNPDGKVQKTVPVANHHGDLCYRDGHLLVAVNLGKFNQPAGQADSWIYEYDAETLHQLARYPLPELVHGAGGVVWDGTRYFVVGGLPEGITENYLYEYSPDWQFRRRHVLQSGYTKLGIQTACLAHDHFWFGCYGDPPEMLKADRNLNLVGRWKMDVSLGISLIPDGRMLAAQGDRTADGYGAALAVVVPDSAAGLRVLEPAPKN